MIAYRHCYQTTQSPRRPDITDYYLLWFLIVGALCLWIF